MLPAAYPLPASPDLLLKGVVSATEVREAEH